MVAKLSLVVKLPFHFWERVQPHVAPVCSGPSDLELRVEFVLGCVLCRVQTSKVKIRDLQGQLWSSSPIQFVINLTIKPPGEKELPWL